MAKRAGVSHAAPAHHFRDVNGLLTAIAARGFERFVARQEDFRRQAPDTPRARLVASGVGYVVFAQEHPALFRLMFGSSRPDFADAGLGSAAAAAHADRARHVAAFTGRDPAAQPDPQAMADVACVWALAHGLADLLVAGRLAAVAALPAQQRLETIAALLGRIVPAGEAPYGGLQGQGPGRRRWRLKGTRQQQVRGARVEAHCIGRLSLSDQGSEDRDRAIFAL